MMQVQTLCLSPDGVLLLSIDSDGRALLVNRKCVATALPTLHAHTFRRSLPCLHLLPPQPSQHSSDSLFKHCPNLCPLTSLPIPAGAVPCCTTSHSRAPCQLPSSRLMAATWQQALGAWCRSVGVNLCQPEVERGGGKGCSCSWSAEGPLAVA
jgi:hypothetical protein